jgi:hypothetical protein
LLLAVLKEPFPAARRRIEAAAVVLVVDAGLFAV